MKKYWFVVKTTFNDSLQYASSLLFRFIGFAITMSILVCLWNYIYSGGDGVINGYSFTQMIWYLLLAEVITYGGGSKVATEEIRNEIKSGNIAYQVNKPYNYILFTICKYLADTLVMFMMILIVAIVLGLIYAGAIPGFDITVLLGAIPIYLLALLIMGMVRILISLTAFWVEDSRPFQMVYGKLVLMFGVFFPIEMLPSLVGKILRFTPIYGVSYGPAKLVLSFSKGFFIEVLLTQLVTVLVLSIIIAIVYGRGVKKLNVNGG